MVLVRRDSPWSLSHDSVWSLRHDGGLRPVFCSDGRQRRPVFVKRHCQVCVMFILLHPAQPYTTTIHA